MSKFFKISSVIILMMMICSISYSETFIKEHTYKAGDDDSKNSARTKTIDQIKKEVLEELGVFVESESKGETIVHNKKVDKKFSQTLKIQVFGTLKVKILEEKWDGTHFYVKVKIEASREAVQNIANKSKCDKNYNEIKKLLNNLSSARLIENIVTKAIQIPFDNQCASNIHFSVISMFLKYKIYNDTYKKFLMDHLDKIDAPSFDQRTQAILKYMAADHLIDEEEWEHSFNVIRRLNKKSFSWILNTIFYYQMTYTNKMDTIYKRIDQIMEHATLKKIGLPRPFDFDFIFFQTLEAFYININNKKNKATLYIYKKYHKNLSDKNNKKIYKNLSRMFKNEIDSETKKLILNYLTDYFNIRKPDYALFKKMINIYKILPDEQYKTLFFKLCKKNFQESIIQYKYNSEKEERVVLCLTLILDCAGLIPGIEEIKEQIRKGNYHQQKEALKILEHDNRKAKALEKEIIKTLYRIKKRDFSGATNLEWQLINILGNIKTENPMGVDILITSLSSLRHKVPDSAIKSLATIGEPVIPRLIELIKNKETAISVKIRSIKIFEKMGKDASKTVPELLRLKQTSKNRALVFAIEDAIEHIK